MKTLVAAPHIDISGMKIKQELPVSGPSFPVNDPQSMELAGRAGLPVPGACKLPFPDLTPSGA
jgi:hypothetical protein